MAFDAVTGSLHRLSPLGKAALDIFKTNPELLGLARESTSGVVLALLRDKFSPKEIDDALEEIFDLYGKSLWVDDGEFFGKEVLEGNRSPINAGVKALCLDVAHDCNLACRYCFAYGGSYGGQRSLMTPETGAAAIEFLVKESKNRMFLDVDFFGGEPMMAFDTVKKCISRAREIEKNTGKIFRFTITTNCTLLNDEAASFLKKENVSLILSLDGRKEVHDAMRVRRGGGGSYDSALKRAKYAVQGRPVEECIVRGTYTRQNLDFYKDVESLYKEGFRHISLEGAVGGGDFGITLSDIAEIKDSYEKVLDFWLKCRREKDPFIFYHFNLGLRGGVCRERRMTGCGAGYEYLAVAPEGSIYPCHQLVGIDEFKMGDIFSPFPRGEKGEKIMDTLYRSRVLNKEECQKCWARYLCGGGCHAAAFFGEGDMSVPESVSCALMKARLEYALLGQYIISV